MSYLFHLDRRETWNTEVFLNFYMGEWRAIRYFHIKPACLAVDYVLFQNNVYDGLRVVQNYFSFLRISVGKWCNFTRVVEVIDASVHWLQ